jgi:hypothetical protein
MNHSKDPEQEQFDIVTKDDTVMRISLKFILMTHKSFCSMFQIHGGFPNFI